MVGGGRNAFIGAVHRLAMRLDDQIALVAGALSSDPENAAASAAEIGIAPERSYADYREMARAEAARPDGIEAVVIVTPNHLHAPIATAFLEAGIDVICDKPLSTTLAEAEALVALARRRKAQVRRDAQQHRLRHGPAGARDGGGRRARADRLRPRRLHPGLADPADRRARARSRPNGAPIRRAPGNRRCWPTSACMPSTWRASSPDARPRRSPPTCSPPCPGAGSTTTRMCWCAGRAGRAARSWPARHRPATTTISPLRIYGDKAGLEWSGTRPEELRFSRYGEETRTLVRGGHGSSEESRRVSRMPAAHPEGYIEAFANFYRDAADIIRAHRSGVAVDPARAAQVPDVVDGARGVKFVAAAVDSAAGGVDAARFAGSCSPGIAAGYWKPSVVRQRFPGGL